jgi:hypothetical protein
LLFHSLSKLYERTSVVITTNLSFSKWAGVFGDTKMMTIFASKPRRQARGGWPRPALIEDACAEIRAAHQAHHRAWV